ncbi:DUF948 domain-containing protein [Paenibacillus doosanensis]|uniref:DUF948 domain-containing protein n=1 Tax=Paenibacillus konkukensis TaxID=2020716 RepID=A0ABY4RMX5_9BACL|nr:MULTISPECIES: DUF948 domain-containing protein [Paenibacillus]MCS7462232.1 DUF948 domain-containing protein [Paenibacillus doosanensis]UQZ82903.1 hypothetical protein SK3146_02063 [Paenibacillus konkukensis]
MWQISISLASLAFVVLAGYLIFLLKESRQAMRQAQDTLNRMQEKLELTAEESVRTIRLSREVLEDVQRRMKATDGFVDAMERTGEAASSLSRSVQLVSRTLSDTVLEARETLHTRQDTVKDLIELTTTGIQLWQRWQAQKPSKTGTPDE